jgi:signal transduction histidine kinase
MRRACSEGPQLFEWRARDSAGRQFWVEVFLKQVHIAGKDRIIASVRDIDARKQAEDKVQHFQRLESVGQLAGGIAHDFNNMLAGILGSIELVLRRLPDDHPSRRLLATAMQSGERAADLNRKLLSFARRNPQQVAARDLHALVDATLALLQRAIQPGVAVESRLEAEQTTVLADAAELQNAILNLCLNARDAMPQGGTISVRTENRQLGPADCTVHAGFSLRPGPHIAVTVADTGTGIPDAVRARMFEPFYTTKEIGKGTGLGLSMVFGTVVAMGGAIAVESAPGRGSSFTVLVPVAPGSPVVPGPQAAVTGRLRGLSVLVVDDDVVPREMAVEMLGELGCTTCSAASGTQALAILQQQGQAIGVVLLDMLMPGLSGVDAFAAIRAIRPDCRIVICSGFIRDTAVAGLLVTGNTCFLAKPYRIDDLAMALVDDR